MLAALAALWLLAGCGRASDSATQGQSRTAAPPEAPRPDRCRVGAPALAAIPAAPPWWREGERPPVILACLRDDAGGAALVGFRLEGEPCVASYPFRKREALDERCTEPGASWTIQCEGRLGCTSAFVHRPGETRLNGPVDARVGRIDVSVDGKPLKGGLMFAAVKGRLARAIGAREPFGFFFVSIPRCVAPAAVRIELLASDGSRLGLAQPWDVIVESCHKLAETERPGA